MLRLSGILIMLSQNPNESGTFLKRNVSLPPAFLGNAIRDGRGLNEGYRLAGIDFANKWIRCGNAKNAVLESNMNLSWNYELPSLSQTWNLLWSGNDAYSALEFRASHSNLEFYALSQAWNLTQSTWHSYCALYIHVNSIPCHFIPGLLKHNNRVYGIVMAVGWPNGNAKKAARLFVIEVSLILELKPYSLPWELS